MSQTVESPGAKRVAAAASNREERLPDRVTFGKGPCRGQRSESQLPVVSGKSVQAEDTQVPRPRLAGAALQWESGEEPGGGPRVKSHRALMAL